MARRSVLIFFFCLVEALLIDCFRVNQQQSLESLFEPSDPSVLVLSKNNFREIVHQKETAFVVLFYLSWCGHCVKFAPIFKQFADSVRRWNTVLRIAAINCAEPDTETFCSDYQVLSFPKMKFFEPKREANVGTEMVVRSHGGPNDILDSMLKLFSNFTNYQPIPENWPQMKMIEARNKPDLLREVPFTKLPTLLVFEKKDSLLGLKVILDFVEFRDRITILRVNGENSDLISGLLPSSYSSFPLSSPVLIRIKSSGEVNFFGSGLYLNEDDVRNLFVHKIDEEFLDNDWTLHTPQDEKLSNIPQVPKGNQILSEAAAKVTPVHFADLYNAIRMSLRNEIGLHRVLNETQVDVVRNYFHVLYSYFPFHNENARRFIKRMTEWMNHQKTIKKENFIAIMKAGSEGFLPQIQPWRSCASSKPNRRGYPCSLWLLFHTLTVSEFLHNHTFKRVQKHHSVLYAMRDYVKHFFTCKHCAEHFSTLSENLENELLYPNSSVLWLWEAHNKVNERLKGDLTEDPMFPKVQFPTSDTCPHCHQKAKRWNKREVLNFLSKHYSDTSVVKNTSQQVTFGLLSFMSLITYIL